MTNKPRALVLTQQYAPEPNFITEQVASALVASHEVVVVTAHPNYPTGRFYPGTRWWTISRTFENGVTVYRVPMFPDHSLSILRRLASYLSFAFIAGVVGLLVAPRAKLVWIYHGPFVSGLSAPVFRLLFGSRLVLTCADLWPESFAAAGVKQTSTTVKLAYSFRRWFNRQMDHIVCATQGTRDVFASEGVPAERLSVIPVWVPLPQCADDHSCSTFDVVYAGNIGPAQALQTAVEGCLMYASESADFRAAFAGTGTDLARLISLVPPEHATQVAFLGHLSPTQALNLCKSAKVQILSLVNTPAFENTVPSKLGFSLAAGTPVIFSAPGETGRIMRALPGTFEFNIGDPQSFADALHRAMALSSTDRATLRSHLKGEYDTRFSAKAGLKSYRLIFDQVVA